MREPKDIIINNKTLEQVLKDHIHWVREDCEGWENMRADLRGANLRNAYLNGANLRNANLDGADLRNANLVDANLCNAYLVGANLDDAYLVGANLRNAYLNGANLRNADLDDANLDVANLVDANLCNADLDGANLDGANLCNANLNGANLRNANLDGADLVGANLCNANLNGAKGNLIEYRRGKILTEDIIGYKKYRNGVIVTLLIPRGAIVFSINGNKCRTNRAKVIGINGTDRAYSRYNNMSYYVGDEFNVYGFNCEYNVECGKGIHFFMTRKDAENYYY